MSTAAAARSIQYPAASMYMYIQYISCMYTVSTELRETVTYRNVDDRLTLVRVRVRA